jgi:tetratricopeptide (TPR) repeat protein
LLRLEHRLPLLTAGARDAPARQQTLRATIEWSYDLLPVELQQLFARLAVFAGTFSLEASEAVVDADVETLGAICEASLVKPLTGGRFLMLETIREFASERFAELEAAEVLRAQHAEYYYELTLAAALDTDVPGEQRPEMVMPDAPNLRAALAWALERDQIEFGLKLLVGLEQFWTLGYTAEALEWYSAFLERADTAPALLRARALRSYGSSASFSGEHDLAESLWEESLAEHQRLGDNHGVAVMLHRLSIISLVHGDIELARERSERSLELHREVANDKGALQPLALLGTLALHAGDRDAGVALLEESAQLARKVGWRWWLAGTLSELADVALADGRDSAARALLKEALGLGLQVHDRVGLSWYLSQFALVLAREGATEEAGKLWGAVETAAVFIPGGPWPRDMEALEREIAGLRDESFEAGCAVGGKHTLEELANAHSRSP